MEGKVQTYDCPKGCGWSRSWHDSPQYLDRVITHPLYGEITGRRLVQADITNHDCEYWWSWQRERKPVMLEAQRLRMLRNAKAA